MSNFWGAYHISKRIGKETYEKDWSAEKEVRLKVGVQQYSNVKNGYEIHDGMIMDKGFFPKIAVPITSEAFDTIKIRFSPNFVNHEKFIEKIREIKHKSIIEILQ